MLHIYYIKKNLQSKFTNRWRCNTNRIYLHIVFFFQKGSNLHCVQKIGTIYRYIEIVERHLRYSSCCFPCIGYAVFDCTKNLAADFAFLSIQNQACAPITGPGTRKFVKPCFLIEWVWIICSSNFISFGPIERILEPSKVVNLFFLLTL